MLLIIQNIAGWLWLHKRIALYVIAAIIIGILIIVAFRSCGKKRIKIDEDAIQKINSANEAERKKELQKVIEENQDVINTVDNRSALSETNVIERNSFVDERVKAADRAIAEAKEQGQNVTSEQLQCILIPEDCQ